jgi:hypothetical protein
MCASLSEGADAGVDAAIGTFNGWEPLRTSEYDGA